MGLSGPIMAFLCFSFYGGDNPNHLQTNWDDPPNKVGDSGVETGSFPPI